MATWRSCSSSSTTAPTPGQARRRQHAPDEQPFGHEPEPRLGPGRLVEADRIADGLADALAQLAGDARRGQPRGQPARLEHPNLPVATPRVEQRARNTRRLARAGRGLDDGGAARRDGVGDRRQTVVDRQRQGWAASSRSSPRPSMGGQRAPIRPSCRRGPHTDIVSHRRFSLAYRRHAAAHRIRGSMIRCPTCGRRIRDAAPVCPAHGPPPPAPPPSEEKTTPFVVPPPDLPAFRVRQDAGAGRLRRRVPRPARVGRTAGRHQGRARRQRRGRRGAAARGRRAGRGRRPPRAGRVRSRCAGKRVGVRRDGVRQVRGALRTPRRARGPDGDRRVLAPCARDPERRRDRARPRPRALRSETRKRVHRRDAGREAVRFRPGAQAGRASASRRPRKRRRRGRPNTCRPNSARRAPTSMRAATSMRWARCSTRCWWARRRSGAIRRRSSRTTAAAVPRRCRAACPSRSRSRRRSCAASPRTRIGASPAPPSFAGRCRRAWWRSGRAGKGPRRARRRRAPAPRRQTSPSLEANRPRVRASGAWWRCCSSRARATSRRFARQATGSARSWRTRRACNTCWRSDTRSATTRHAPPPTPARCSSPAGWRRRCWST